MTTVDCSTPVSGCDFHTLLLDRDGAVSGNPHRAAHAPQVRPPRVAFTGPQHTTPFPHGLVPGLLGCHLELAVCLVPVVVFTQEIELLIGRAKVPDIFGEAEAGKSVLPEVVVAFDLPLGQSRQLRPFGM